jgi:hypothetical protein
VASLAPGFPVTTRVSVVTPRPVGRVNRSAAREGRWEAVRATHPQRRLGTPPPPENRGVGSPCASRSRYEGKISGR